MVINEIKKKDVLKRVSDVFAKLYYSSSYLTLRIFDQGNVWLSDTAVFKFKLSNEFKSICGFKCQKAIGQNPKGEQVFAWFTEQIPISAGPVYISGLPGLVLAYYNPKQKIYYLATKVSSTDIPNQNFRNWLTGPIVNVKEYVEISNGNMKKFNQFQNMLETQKH